MVEQKNKLAYENGKLRSTVSRLQQEISDVTRDQADITQLRRLTESLQAKYTKVSSLLFFFSMAESCLYIFLLNLKSIVN